MSYLTQIWFNDIINFMFVATRKGFVAYLIFVNFCSWTILACKRTPKRADIRYRITKIAHNALHCWTKNRVLYAKKYTGFKTTAWQQTFQSSIERSSQLFGVLQHSLFNNKRGFPFKLIGETTFCFLQEQPTVCCSQALLPGLAWESIWSAPCVNTKNAPLKISSHF